MATVRQLFWRDILKKTPRKRDSEIETETQEEIDKYREKGTEIQRETHTVFKKAERESKYITMYT